MIRAWPTLDSSRAVRPVGLDQAHFLSTSRTAIKLILVSDIVERSVPDKAIFYSLHTSTSLSPVPPPFSQHGTRGNRVDIVLPFSLPFFLFTVFCSYFFTSFFPALQYSPSSAPYSPLLQSFQSSPCHLFTLSYPYPVFLAASTARRGSPLLFVN